MSHWNSYQPPPLPPRSPRPVTGSGPSGYPAEPPAVPPRPVGFWESLVSPEVDQEPEREPRTHDVTAHSAPQPSPAPVSRSPEGIEGLLQDLVISAGPGTPPKGASQDGTYTRPDNAPTSQAPPPSSRARTAGHLTGTTACINPAMAFPTTWYDHPDAPGIWICSRCYEKHIQDSRFQGSFVGRFFDDHQLRGCSFNTPRITDYLWKDALKAGSLQELIRYMKLRATIPDCKGIDGIKGSEGTSWFTPKDNAIPGLVVCRACWEDHVLARSFSAKFEPVSFPQAAEDIWACDMAVAYIRSQYADRSDANDWPGFLREASDRLKVPACPKTQKVALASRKWFFPIDRPEVLICAACMCDHIFGSGEEEKWRDAGSSRNEYASDVACANGQFGINLAMSVSEYKKDYSVLWSALDAAVSNQACTAGPIKGATWYTLRSDPRDFGICGGCYGMVIKSMDLTGFFIPKTIPPDLEYSCCLSPGFPRYAVYVLKLVEAYFTGDPTALEQFSAEYTTLPICRRDKTVKNGLWYGWDDCTICPECHHEFIRGTALAESMPWQGVRYQGSIMCDLYSPRMRTLYLEACAAKPPDPSALRAYARQRAQVYVRTMMRVEQILRQQRLALGEQARLNASSSFYTHIGNVQAASMGSAFTYGAAGVGYGFQNQNQLQGAIYGKQATAAGSGIGAGPVSQVAELERQWREVE